MEHEPTKPVAIPADDTGMEQATATDKSVGDAVPQENEQAERAAEEAATQLGDVA